MRQRQVPAEGDLAGGQLLPIFFDATEHLGAVTARNHGVALCRRVPKENKHLRVDEGERGAGQRRRGHPVQRDEQAGHILAAAPNHGVREEAPAFLGAEKVARVTAVGRISVDIIIVADIFSLFLCFP